MITIYNKGMHEPTQKDAEFVAMVQHVSNEARTG